MVVNDRFENLELQGGLAKDTIMPAVETVENMGKEKAHKVFTHVEERKLVRKLDLWIVPLMMFTYMLQSYDKGILSAATQFDLNADLGLTTVIGYEANGTPITNNKKYSNASMIFYVGYVIGTYPMSYLAQRFSISRVISGATFFWGIVVMSTAGCINYGGIIVNRLVLGILESAVAPTFTVLVTFWWTREEQGLRTGLWYCCVGVATAISPLINYGLGQIHGPLASWKPMFLILGAVTTLWSIVLFFGLPDNPMETKGLTDAERELAIQRLERNKAGTITHSFNRAQFLEAFRDYKMYSCSLLILLTGVPSGAIGTFGTIVINGFGFSHFESLALTCPIGAITALSILLVSYVSRKFTNTSYLVFIPLDYSSDAETPVIFSYHGGDRTAKDQLELDELTSPEFNTHTLVVYPQGINEKWQGVPNDTTNDIQFTTDILNQVESRYCIDQGRVWTTGKSDGAGFCNILACDSDLSLRFSVFAPVSGAYYVDSETCDPDTVSIPCSPGRKDIPFLAFHGGNDTTIAYAGGERKDECLPSIPHFIQEWAARDDLPTHNITKPLATDTVVYSFGDGLVELVYDSVIGHDWPSTVPNSDNSVAGHHPASFNATPIIMNFFEAHSVSRLGANY
ncbi:uncharacterized protein BHQ10_003562 [Talaromyces amestolkiae]|uniref:Major facilitator superfamily (MFS) profile domain-containing protein n=1 Tax=Talaromyces amestolkiae TaxID=1196081 RepID=A0A364KVH6_TALAM|nr:uncharacterized protein BHQ10_003562 [Talaromyces amestolkiae]RAO67550.1 hypothetical protein BHQ10_003562 [Talaromyces amestolkiae]